MENYKEFIARKNAEFQKTALKPFKDIGRRGSHEFMREAWTFMVQHNLKNKVFVIERLKRIKIHGKTVHSEVKVGDIEYRFGYYIVGQIGRAKNRWVWGQFCPMIPDKDFSALIKKAKKEGTLLA